jgi:hypothetical protein
MFQRRYSSGGAAVAEELATALLDEAAGLEAGTGDGDEGVAGRDAVQGPLVEEEGVGVAEVVAEPAGHEAALGEDHVRGVDPGEGLDAGVGEALAFEAGPGPGGVDALELAAALKLAGQLKVMEDTEDSLGDDHEVGCAFPCGIFAWAAMASVYRDEFEGTEVLGTR